MTESALSLLGCSTISCCTRGSFIFVTIGCWWPGSVSPFKEIASLASGLWTTVKWPALVWSFFGNCATKQREVMVLVARIGWKSRTPGTFVCNVNMSKQFDIQGAVVLFSSITTQDLYRSTLYQLGFVQFSRRLRFKCTWQEFLFVAFHSTSTICVKYVP